jgi:branched-chain amino acid transport system permease protein
MHFLGNLLVNVVLTTPLVGAYTMFALGIVFIYRGSKVLNLAHGSMAMFPAYVAYSLAPHTGVLVALIAALVSGAAIGLGVERAVVRRLRASSPTAQTVGTVAVLGLLIAVAARVWGTGNVTAPKVFPDHVFRVGNAQLQLGSIGLFVIALAAAGGFIALFRYTDLGLAMRASADNRRAASLMGIDPDRTTAVAWLFAGVLAALGGVLLGATTNLNPYILSLQVLPAFVAALIGGLENIKGALVGSVIVGFTIGLVPVLIAPLPLIGKLAGQNGADTVFLGLVAFAVMVLRGQRFSASDVRSGL